MEKNNLKGKKEERGEAIYRACRAFFTAEFMIPVSKRGSRDKRSIFLSPSSTVRPQVSKDSFNDGYHRNYYKKRPLWIIRFDDFYKNLWKDTRKERGKKIESIHDRS